MATTPLEDGLRIVDTEAQALSVDADEAFEDDGRAPAVDAADTDVETLRDAFVEAFNARDLDSLLGLVLADVECPDIAGDGAAVLAEEIESIWERSPAAILTRAFLDDTPCAVGWMPDEDGCWSKAALVCFDANRGLLSLVSMPEDADGLDRAETEEPAGEELEEWVDWAEWDRGEETVQLPRDRARP